MCVLEELSFSSTYLLCVDLFLIMHCIMLMHYFRQFYSNKKKVKFIRLQSTSGIVQQTAVILLLIYWPPLLPTIKHYTLSKSDKVIVSQLKEKLVSLKKYQYVLLVKLQSKWNKRGLHHEETYTQTWVWMEMVSGKQGFLWADFN